MSFLGRSLLGSSASSANQSLVWVMGSGGKGHIIIEFPFALDSGWYSEQTRTEFLHFEHRKERNGFKHEFIVLRLANESLCRIERVGDPNARLNSISSRGSTAYDMAQTFQKADTPAARLETSDVVAEIILPFEFDIMDVLKVCRAIHEGETTRNYTLQVYNCWFFSLAIQVCLARLIAYWEDPELLGTWLSKLREGVDALIEHPELGRLLQSQKIFKIYPMLTPLGNDGEKNFMEEVGRRLKSRLMDLSGDLRAEIRCRINDLLWHSTIREDLSGFIEELVKLTILELLEERFLTVPDSYHGPAQSPEQLKHQLLSLWTSLLRSSGTRTRTSFAPTRSQNIKQKPIHPARDTPSRCRSNELGIQPQHNQQTADHAAYESLLQYIINKLGAMPESTPTLSQLENKRKPVYHAAHDSSRWGGVGKSGIQHKLNTPVEEEGSFNIHRLIMHCKPYLGQVVAWLLDAISLIWGITILAPQVVLTVEKQLEAIVTELEGLGKISCSDLERVIQALRVVTESQTRLWFDGPWDDICRFLEEHAMDDLNELFKPKVDFIAKYGRQEKSDSETIALFQDHILERIKIHAQEVERNWLGSAVNLQAQLKDVLSLVWERIREDESLTDKVSNMTPANQTLVVSGDMTTATQTDRSTDTTAPLSVPPNQSSIMLEGVLTPAQADRPADTRSPSPEPPNETAVTLILEDVTTPAQTDQLPDTTPPSSEPVNQTAVALEDVPTPAHIDQPINTPSPELPNQAPVALKDVSTRAQKDRQTDTISPSPAPNHTPVTLENIAAPAKKGNVNSRTGFRKTLRSWISSSSSGLSDSPSSRPASTANAITPPTSPLHMYTQRGDVEMEDGTSSPRSSRPPSMPVPQPLAASSSFRDSLQIPRSALPRSRIPSIALPLPENETHALSSLATQCALTLSEVTKEIAPIPAIGQLVGCLKHVFQAVERSKVNKDQWKLLRGRCVMVLRIGGAHVENYGKDQYPNLDEAAALLQETLNRVEDRARHYNGMNELIALVLFQSISDEIQMLFADLDACLALFGFTAEVAREQWTGEYQAVQQRESSELQRLRGELEKMNIKFDSLRQNQEELLEKTNKMVDALQQVLVDKSMILQDQTTANVASHIDAQQLVRTILSVTSIRLPPRLLLGKQCIPDSFTPIKNGITCDIYSASFLGGEKVAKKVFRIGMSDRDYVEKYARRFLRIATLWSDFRSDYTLPFYGIGMESFDTDSHFQLYMVSPLMKNFDAITFLKHYRGHQGMKKNILRILTDAAKGLQYLHNRTPPVVHSGMRGDNILITDSEGGILGGFGLTKVLESDTNLPPVVMTGKTESQRWMAPEMFVDDPPLATPCDIWGWAMTALEIISGLIPYHMHKQAMTIMLKITKGPPHREHYPKFEQYAHRPDEMWELLLMCWAMEPSERPTIDEVVGRLEQIAKMPEVGA